MEELSQGMTWVHRPWLPGGGGWKTDSARPVPAMLHQRAINPGIRQHTIPLMQKVFFFVNPTGKLIVPFFSQLPLETFKNPL